MKSKKSPDSGQNKNDKKTNPIRTNQDVEKNPDKHIDQDFSGYPHAPASRELINPKTKQEKKSAAINIKDGEKNKMFKKKCRFSPEKLLKEGKNV